MELQLHKIKGLDNFLLKSYTTDIEIDVKIDSNVKVKNVHYHTIDKDNKYRIVYLDFKVIDNILYTTLPAFTRFFGEIECETEKIK